MDIRHIIIELKGNLKKDDLVKELGDSMYMILKQSKSSDTIEAILNYILKNKNMTSKEEVQNVIENGKSIDEIVSKIGRIKEEGEYLLNLYAIHKKSNDTSNLIIINKKIEHLLRNFDNTDTNQRNKNLKEAIETSFNNDAITDLTYINMIKPGQSNGTPLINALEQRNVILQKKSGGFVASSGFVATSQRVLLNGRQNRIVYKKNGKGVKYVKIQNEFVKLKQSML